MCKQFKVKAIKPRRRRAQKRISILRHMILWLWACLQAPFLVAGGFNVTVSKTYPECTSSSYPSPCVAEAGYSGEYKIQGSGTLLWELREVIGTPIPPMGGWRNYPFSVQYQEQSLAWKDVEIDLFYGFSGSRQLIEERYNDGSNGQPYFHSWKFRVINGLSPLGRLAVVPHRNYEAYGFYQINSTVTNKLTFLERDLNPSTISDQGDKAGANCPAQPYTVFDLASFSLGQGLPHYSVNTAYLNLVIEDMDFGCQSHGLNESLQRVWNMRPSLIGMFGNGWTFAYESTLLAQPYLSGGSGDVILKSGSGQQTEYRVSSSEASGLYMTQLNYTRFTPGLGPILTARIGNGTDIGEYTLTDQAAKLTYHYEIADYLLHGGAYLYRLTAVSDRNNNRVILDYDAEGRLVSLTDSSNRQTRFGYDAQNRVTAMATFDGRQATFDYDAKNNLTRSVDLAGNVSTYTHDDKNYPISMTVAGRTTRFEYAENTAGERFLASVTEPDGNVRRYRFGGSENSLTEPGGSVLVFGNNNGRTTWTRNALGQVTATAYNGQFLPIQLTDPLGRIIRKEYDASGNLTKHTDPAGQVTTYTYDADWNLTSVTNALGQTTRFEYDSRHNLVKETSPLGRVTAYQVDDKGQVTRITQPDGQHYVMSYDVHGNLTGITNPLGQTSGIAYDAQGLNPTALTDALGHATGYTYDANRRLTAIRPADGTEILFNRDCCSLTSATDGAGNTTQYQRDAVYRPIAITDPLGSQSTLAYNADGDLATATDPLGHSSQIGYDKTRRPTLLTDALGGKIQFSRDAVGNVTTLTDERGKVTTMTYDTRDLLSAIKDPLGKSVSYSRDALGRITSITNARGESIGLVYDADGRLIEKKYQGTTVVQYVWDTNNQLVSVSDPTGIKRFQRDPAGRITRITYPDDKTIGFVYNANGNRTAVTYPDGLTATYTYDSLNRFASVSFAGNTLNLSYDAAGNLIGETRSNGVTSSYGYDAANQLIRVNHQRAGAVIADITYTHNAAGLITREAGTWPLSPSHMFEDATATHDDANAIVSWNSDTYTHDADGNLTGISGSRSFAAQYDPENRPTAITRSGSTTQYAYDGLNNRVRGQSPSLTRRYYHDESGTLLTDIDTTNNVVTHYIHAGSRLVAAGSVGKGYVFHHFDKTGNTLALTDTTGQVVGAYAYDAYGKVVARSGSVTTPFTYVGAFGVIEGAENLFFMRNRYYDAVTGRFIQRDPIGFGGGYISLYIYVGNEPISQKDSIGLKLLPQGQAMIMDIKREVTASIVEGGSWKPELGEVILSGTIISTGDNSSVTLLHLGSNEEVTFGPGTTASVCTSGITILSGKENVKVKRIEKIPERLDLSKESLEIATGVSADKISYGLGDTRAEYLKHIEQEREERIKNRSWVERIFGYHPFD